MFISPIRQIIFIVLEPVYKVKKKVTILLLAIKKKMHIQNLSMSCIQIEVTKLQVLFDSKKPKLASPLTLLP